MRNGTGLLLLAMAWGLAACGDGEGVGTPPPNQPPVPDPVIAMDGGPWVLDLERGQTQFVEKCQHCHGVGAIGGYGPPLTSTVTCAVCAEFSMLWRRIDEFMPFRNPEACDAACSRDIAAWISNGFSTLPSCSVDFRYESVVGQRFTATVSIFNFGGRDVPIWRLGFTLPANYHLDDTRNAIGTQAGEQVMLRPLAATPVIAHGATLEIMLEGTQGGLASVPSDLRLEASPCFTAPPTL